jgi:C4-dicarboxylate-specific signal transduction histidine kinase
LADKNPEPVMFNLINNAFDAVLEINSDRKINVNCERPMTGSG